MFSSTSQSWEHLSVSIYCLWHLTFSCIRVGVVPVCINMRHSEDKLLFLFFGQNRSSSRATATSLTPDTSRWFESPLRLRPANQSGRRESASMREVENLLTSGHFTKHIENRITGARQLQFDSAKISCSGSTESSRSDFYRSDVSSATPLPQLFYLQDSLLEFIFW